MQPFRSLATLIVGAVLVCVTALTGAPRVAPAGPPMVCHEIQIGDARTLPKVAEDVRSYPTERLTREALALLTPGTPTLVRMETLRRAVQLGERDPGALAQLLGALQARVLDAEARDRPDAEAWFDAAYLAGAWWQQDRDRAPEVGLREGCVGYAWLKRALVLGKEQGELEFAAALMTHPAMHKGTHELYQRHLRRAAQAAAPGSLLEKNVQQHCRDWQQSFADLRQDQGEADAGGKR